MSKKKWILTLLLILVCSGAIYFYLVVLKPQVSNFERSYFYIPTGSNFETVVDGLVEHKLISNRNNFVKLAKYKKYDRNVKPGRYRIKNGMSNNALINLLRSGVQEEVQVTFNHVRTKEQLCKQLTKNLEADEEELLGKLRDKAYCESLGFDTHSINTLFLPNTYRFYWNTSADQIMQRMRKEYKQFWNTSRKQKAQELQMSQSEVTTLASIVKCETNKEKDAPKIAGVYINRLKKGIPLQADPTLIYAIGDFTIRRVLNKDKKINSPYNTYTHTGLPPGPIYITSGNYIDHVLNYEKHNYLFFCAKEDLSGYSNFAKTYPEHKRNARKYQRALDKRNIKR